MLVKWSNHQFSFKLSKCTEDAGHRLKDFVNCSTSKHVIGVYIDFRNAFDYLRWPVIMQRLKDVGCSNNELKLWNSYFKNRHAWMFKEREHFDVHVERGCPQGSIAGPTIWKICMDTFLEQLCAANIKCVDLVLVIEDKSRVAIE